MPSRRSAACVALAVLGLAACTSNASVTGQDADRARRSTHARVVPSPSPLPSSGRAAPTVPLLPSVPVHTATSEPPPPAPAGATAHRLLAGLSERQRVGQLLMVDCPSTGVSPATAAAIVDEHVGAVILDGTTTAGVVAVRSVTDTLRGLAPRTGLLVATDQEGGQVQRLQGPGFAAVPSAVQQGRLRPATLRADAAVWGAQLSRAGVDVNLAPVLDTVPPGSRANPPIGDLQREYGRSPASVRAHGIAYARGMAQSGVDATAKHFPGLGRVTGNTDATSGVTDRITTRRDAYLAPFRAAVRAHVPFVMISSAIYARIDPGRPAVFSHTIVTGMLRGDLGYRGLIVSDDVGAAAQLARYSAGERAVAFVRAGGDLVLTVNAAQAGPMTDALLRESRRSPAFRRQVDAAALLVLQAKQAQGVLG